MGNERKYKVLIVDDDESARGLYVDVLEGAGFVVKQAHDGVEALESISQDVPDILFTGIIMPRMDGFTLVESLRKNVVTANVPVVFSSHLGRREDQARAEQLGAKGFFVLGMTSANDVVSIIKAIVTGGEYEIRIDAHALDADRLAHDLGIDPSFVAGDGEYRLHLRVKDKNAKTFEGELVSE